MMVQCGKPTVKRCSERLAEVRGPESPDQFYSPFGYALGDREGIHNRHQIPKRFRYFFGRPIAPTDSGRWALKNTKVQVARRIKRESSRLDAR